MPSLVLFASLLFTFLSGVFALGRSSLIFHKLSQGLLIVSGVLGTIASLQVLLVPGTILQFQISASTLFPVFQLDAFGAIFFLVVSLVSIFSSLYAIPYLASYKETYHLQSLNALAAAFVLGMQIVILSQGPLPFMLGWEVMSIASFFLVVSDRAGESIRAALLYLVMTHLGAAALFAGFLLISQGLLFTDFAMLSSLAREAPAWMLSLSFGLFFFGFGAKAGLVPFHVWLPEAHPAAPSHISALMSGVMLKVAVYGFLRVALFILPGVGTTASLVILGAGLLSAFYGVLYAVVERDLKRVLAFSSIENIGLIFSMIGVAFFARSQGLEALFQTALAAALFFVIAHAVFKSGLFLAAGVIVRAVHSRNLETMGGLAKRMPFFSMVFFVLALAAASLPPFAPFFGEWMFFQSLLQNFSLQAPLVIGVLMFTFVVMALVGGLAIFAMVKLFAISMLAQPRSEAAKAPHELPRASEVAGIAALAALALLAGVFAPNILSLIGAGMLTSSPTHIALGQATVQPALIFFLLAGCVLFVWIIRRLVSRVEHERAFHSWDCGAPIDASMEYTVTAFSGPIRFFFRLLLRTKKTIVAVPVVATNPWIATRSVTIGLRSIWMDYLYLPLGRFIIASAQQVKKIQNGNIRFYLFLMFLTLMLTLWIAL